MDSGLSDSTIGNTNTTESQLEYLDARARDIFQQLVDTFIATGAPVGARTISHQLAQSISAATVRNVMQDLEEIGLLRSPHTSAGRLPTETGLRLFVDTMLRVETPTSNEREAIVTGLSSIPTDMSDLGEAFAVTGEVISGLSRCAGLVLAPGCQAPIKHIEFVRIEVQRALVVLVMLDGRVENRIVRLPDGLPDYALQEAAVWVNKNLRGLTLSEVEVRLRRSLIDQQVELDELTGKVVSAGFAAWTDQPNQALSRNLIVRGRGNLFSDVGALSDIDRVRILLDDMESKRSLIELLSMVEKGDAVKIFIGSESNRASLDGHSVVAAPFRGVDDTMVGVLAVVGPKRMNYAKIVPVVDFSARVISDLIRSRHAFTDTDGA